MTTVGAYEAKTHLADLLRRVEAGERIRITRNGRPIADLVRFVGSQHQADGGAFPGGSDQARLPLPGGEHRGNPQEVCAAD